jgi:hypothetical protein
MRAALAALLGSTCALAQAQTPGGAADSGAEPCNLGAAAGSSGLSAAFAVEPAAGIEAAGGKSGLGDGMPPARGSHSSPVQSGGHCSGTGSAIDVRTVGLSREGMTGL